MPCDTGIVTVPSTASAYVSTIAASSPANRELDVSFTVMNDGDVGVEATVTVDVSAVQSGEFITQSKETVTLSNAGDSNSATVNFVFNETNMPDETEVSACAEVTNVSEI